MPTIYYNSKPIYLIWYLKEYYRTFIVDNRDIIPAQIQLDECLRFSNNISY